MASNVIITPPVNVPTLDQCIYIASRLDTCYRLIYAEFLKFENILHHDSFRDHAYLMSLAANRFMFIQTSGINMVDFMIYVPSNLRIAFLQMQIESLGTIAMMRHLKLFIDSAKKIYKESLEVCPTNQLFEQRAALYRQQMPVNTLYTPEELYSDRAKFSCAQIFLFAIHDLAAPLQF